MTESAVSTRDLFRDYGGRPALRGMTVSVAPGSITVLAGPNGAGKSTLLRLVAGMLAPSSGECRVFGSAPFGSGGSAAARTVAIIDGCEPPGSASCELVEGLYAASFPRFDREFAERVARGGISERGLSLGSLSKGQRRRFLAGLALASRADLTLLDEPADGLDPRARRELYDVLRDVATEGGGTYVVATHILQDMERVADDLILVDDGREVLVGELESLREEIREIELPPGTAFELPESWVILKDSRASGGGLTVRIPAGEGPAHGVLPPHAFIRRLGLEDLYLRLTDPGEPVRSGDDGPKGEDHE